MVVRLKIGTYLQEIRGNVDPCFGKTNVLIYFPAIFSLAHFNRKEKCGGEM